MTPTLFRAFVPGIPRPKGSLDFMPNGHVAENNKNTDPWLNEMVGEFTRRVRVQAGRPDRRPLRIGFPICEPVSVQLYFHFPRPKNPKFDVPATTATGDSDKLTRAVYDALTRASVWTDDSLVVEAYQIARYVPTVADAGVLVGVAGYGVPLIDPLGRFSPPRQEGTP